MTVMRTVYCGCTAMLAALAGAAPASADEILVMGAGGRVHAREDRFVPPPELPAPPRGAARARAAGSNGRSVGSTLKRMRNSGRITPEEYSERRSAYRSARRTAARVSGTRGSQVRSVIATIEGIARRRKLTRSRLAPLWLTLDRNLEWWFGSGPLLASGQRVGFEGSELVWQYYPGQGLQLQMLGNFGKLNWLWRSRQKRRMGAMLDELLPLAARRAGGIAWEYYFAFGGGLAPWVSGMAQGTALEAISRVATRLGRTEEVLPFARRGLAIFEKRTPVGVRVPTKHGVHYALYSFAPSLRVINGFIQSLVGLYDFAELADDERARELFEEGDRQARRELPTYDTGAWSLYSRGSVTRESDLSYHELLTGFLVELCTRTGTPVYCRTADRFDAYLRVPPVIDVHPRRLPRGRYGRVRFDLSKISTVTLRITRGDTLVESRFFGTVARGRRSFGWAVPRRRGAYTVELTARDRAGNTGSDTATVTVVRARRRS